MTGELKEVLWFVIPKAHQVAAMIGCHWDAGHQGQQQTLYLLQDWFWWSSMAMQMQKVISSCEQCIQHERHLSQSANAAHHCHCSFGIATHGFHKH